MANSSRTTIVDRLRQTSLGPAVTLFPALLLAALHFSFAPQIVARGSEMTLEEKAGFASLYRSSLLETFAYPLSLIALYWLLTAIFAKGDLLRVRPANITLGLAIISISIVGILPFFLSPEPPALAKVCSVLGISQTDWPPGFDTQSSCDRFSGMTIATMWVILPAFLLTISAGFRIFFSRLRWKLDVC